MTSTIDDKSESYGDVTDTPKQTEIHTSWVHYPLHVQRAYREISNWRPPLIIEQVVAQKCDISHSLSQDLSQAFVSHPISRFHKFALTGRPGTLAQALTQTFLVPKILHFSFVFSPFVSKQQ